MKDLSYCSEQLAKNELSAAQKNKYQSEMAELQAQAKSFAENKEQQEAHLQSIRSQLQQQNSAAQVLLF